MSKIIRILPVILLALSASALLFASGCTISSHESGGDKRVSIDAPGASVHVDTGKAVKDPGIPVYPGAVVKVGGKDKDNDDNAHVDVDTPFFKIKVISVTYTSSDAPEKILAFYRNKLTGFGKVLECRNNHETVKISMGDKHSLSSPVECGDTSVKDGSVVLKTGTDGNQHVVSVKPSGTGCEFDLVYVHMGAGKDDDAYSGKQPS
jgi:hypothetical protein